MPKRRRFWSAAALTLIPLLTLASQWCMKLLAQQTAPETLNIAWIMEFLDSRYALGLLLAELMSFLFWMHLLAHVDISRAVPFTSVSYVLILAAGYLVFDESLTFSQCFGAILILLGVWLISTASTSNSVTHPHQERAKE